MTSPPSRAAAIVDIFESCLGRLPDPGALQFYHGSSQSLEDIEAGMPFSAEGQALASAAAEVRDLVARSGRPRNLLLFGAFGNGNLGDRMMADYIATHLETRYPDTAIFAHSLLDLSDYPFTPDRLVGRIQPEIFYGMLNRIVLRNFDALVIGGGGLLAFPHVPLWDPSLPHLLDTPYALHACGFASPLPPETVNLVDAARFASARDPAGLTALQARRSDAVLCPDPVLSLHPRSAATFQDGEGRAFILRGPLTAQHHAIAETLRADDVVIGMEISVDWPLQELFPDIRFVRSGVDLIDAMKDHGTVVSERYHGVILALTQGKASFGVCRNDHNRGKIIELFNALGAPQWCGSQYSLPQGTFPHDAARRYLARAASQYDEAVTRMMTSFHIPEL